MRTPVQKFIVRLPHELHTQLKRMAKQQNRSMNHELIDRLEKSLVNDDIRNIDEQLVTLLLHRIEFLEKRLESLQKDRHEP
ncbi:MULTISPECIES: Arc family DNA-binding protein [Pseudomonas]|uniref:Arc family DNA-binding protein n=1 Tax=Pseudomonas sessilinigenes TaxID=658629 RepID=A0ABX8MKC3_9PSED|nr:MULTISPECIES: Arc family DNA-binding protein [Pseudomonas]AZC27430.1 hypothetical protein C4K39_5790 [Pseudomonas sessilinigenes]QIH09584.1 Arc family DNA-binding protein [Pseudomonas sp. BIOMIG1BAC]QXH38664.1 Arc family DNA-binding protein [Pseudomonas sessilinigenes]UMZ09848.1 Arc family DNA-binding protein [Pseudomonas sp. MPFS]